MKVLDASAVVDIVARTPRGKRVRRELGTDGLAAPELIDVEALSALARLARAGAISWQHANDSVERLGQMSIDRVTHEHLSVRAWQLRDRVRVSDAFYVACAELLRASLVTCDGPLTRAPLPGVTIIYVR